MIAAGEIEPIDCAIFADTQAEPKAVYRWLDWLETQVPFPIHRVSAGNLKDNLISGGAGRFASIPAFTVYTGQIGMTRRQCTREFKLEPLQQKVRELLGLNRRQRGPKTVQVHQLIGISFDERQRMKDSGKSYVQNIYPLVDRRINRRQCLEWMEAHGFPKPSKSACTFCPYHDEAMWRDMKKNDPESFAEAVEVDEALRSGKDIRATRGMKSAIYIHRSCTPLKDVDFRNADDMGQMQLDSNWATDGMQNECEGMCGV